MLKVVTRTSGSKIPHNKNLPILPFGSNEQKGTSAYLRYVQRTPNSLTALSVPTLLVLRHIKIEYTAEKVKSRI